MRPIVVLVGLCAIAASKPFLKELFQAGKATPIPYAQMISQYNITDADVANFNKSSPEALINYLSEQSSGDIAPQRSFEIGKNICAHRYRFLWNSWIVQMPPEWWKWKWGSRERACERLWWGLSHNLVKDSPIWRECWEMDDKWRKYLLHLPSC